MRFLFRAIGGLLLLVLAVAFLGFAAVKLKNAFSEKAEASFKTKYGQERTYTAYVETLKSTQIKPKIMAYGEAKSWRSLELRAANPGRLVFLSENFREGGMVSFGELLFNGSLTPAVATSLTSLPCKSNSFNCPLFMVQHSLST